MGKQNAKKIKVILSVFMCIIMFSNLPIYNVYAAENNAKKEIVVTEEYAKSQREKGMLRYGEREVITVMATEEHSFMTTPTGQMEQGTKFSHGGYVYIQPNTGGVDSISVGLAWELFSFSISLGKWYGTNVVTGDAVYFPAGDYYIVRLNRTFRFERHKVDVYQYTDYQYTYYTTVKKEIRKEYILERVE